MTSTTSTSATSTSVLSDDIVAACAPWSAVLRPGQALQIIDLHGNQAVDTLFYGVHPGTAQVDPTKRYNCQTTVAGP